MTGVNKFKFKVGDVVELVSATFGWGNAAEGDVCVITQCLEDEKHLVYQMNEDMLRYTAWHGEERDIKIFDIQDKTKVAHRFYLRYKKFLVDIPLLAEEDRKVVQADINKLEYELQHKARLCRSLRAYINSANYLAEKAIADKDTKAMFTVLLSSMYESVEFVEVEKCIIAVTKPITTSVEGVPLQFGRYTVHLHYRDGLLRIDRTRGDAEFDRCGKYQHPHILNTIPCLGDFHILLVRAQAAMDFAGMLEIVYSYLCQVYPGSTYNSFLLWAPDRIKRCKRCNLLLEKCECGACQRRFNPLEAGDVLRAGEDASNPSVAMASGIGTTERETETT